MPELHELRSASGGAMPGSTGWPG